jgi:hypothetical protein
MLARPAQAVISAGLKDSDGQAIVSTLPQRGQHHPSDLETAFEFSHILTSFPRGAGPVYTPGPVDHQDTPFPPPSQAGRLESMTKVTLR